MRDPWIFLGWLLCVVVGISLILVPVAGVLMLRARQRAVRRHAEWLTDFYARSPRARERAERRAQKG
jgi:hypothetical protein